MKLTAIGALAALAFLASPVFASTHVDPVAISPAVSCEQSLADVCSMPLNDAATVVAAITDVDHPDIPNCVMFPKSGHNAPNCETLSIMAVMPHEGKGYSYHGSHIDPGPDGILGTPDDVTVHSIGYSY